MRRTAVVIAITLAITCVSAAAASAAPGTIKLSPQQETSDVDSMAPSAAHIHSGERNVAGAVVVGLITPPAATASVSECITAVEGGALTPTELAAIAADPKAHYVNVHTSNYPGGEIRGQLK